MRSKSKTGRGIKKKEGEISVRKLEKESALLLNLLYKRTDEGTEKKLFFFLSFLSERLGKNIAQHCFVILEESRAYKIG